MKFNERNVWISSGPTRKEYTGAAPHPGNAPRHGGQRRVTLYSNEVADDKLAIPLLA